METKKLSKGLSFVATGEITPEAKAKIERLKELKRLEIEKIKREFSPNAINC